MGKSPTFTEEQDRRFQLHIDDKTGTPPNTIFRFVGKISQCFLKSFKPGSNF